MKPDIFLSIVAGLLNVLAFAIYNWQTWLGKTNPNISSWAVWGFMTALNFTSYRAMSQDCWKSLLPTISGIQCILTFFLALFVGEIKSLSLTDRSALVIGIIASLWWRKSKSPTATNLMLQLGITIGFIPTFHSVWLLPASESAMCWFIWAISFLIQTGVVILRWKGKKQDLVYPVNCVWLHLVVGLMALR